MTAMDGLTCNQNILTHCENQRLVQADFQRWCAFYTVTHTALLFGEEEGSKPFFMRACAL